MGSDGILISTPSEDILVTVPSTVLSDQCFERLEMEGGDDTRKLCHVYFAPSSRMRTSGELALNKAQTESQGQIIHSILCICFPLSAPFPMKNAGTTHRQAFPIYTRSKPSKKAAPSASQSPSGEPQAASAHPRRIW
jgi:hypothetical protein